MGDNVLEIYFFFQQRKDAWRVECLTGLRAACDANGKGDRTQRCEIRSPSNLNCMNWPSIRLLLFLKPPTNTHKAKKQQAAFNLEKIYKAKINFKAFPIRNSTTPRNLNFFFSHLHLFHLFRSWKSKHFLGIFFSLLLWLVIRKKKAALFFQRRILLFIESQLSGFFFFHFTK